ncbi:glycoside hydrolase family 43 protein [Amycolatopsis nigrescens]|uniref:glycoside hydrolase family 43 protein n=1 Tax=Amycolatopsis nigrescens TaxID=381445 RepID=UPI00035DA714|nr:glycoside hydrolase family 43 protein [Amycolatopsis nigrescens]
MFVLMLLSGLVPGIAQAAGAGTRTDATYFNDAKTPGADPYVRFDKASGYYYAYSTEGADPGYQFGVYRSPDLATWERLPGGALRADDPGNWAHDWFWAPEVYLNERTGVYFLFYSGRMNTGVAEHFKYPDFEEASKVGVAVSKSPAGPFTNIAAGPIDYFPYDPDYHDVNLIMDAEQKKPPATLAEGETAPLGTYLPFIDPNVFFDDDGRIYLYFSRNAYRNWVWDHDLGKYVEESNIYAVELTGDWWQDPLGATMPAVQPPYRNRNLAPGDPPGTRKDGFTPILSYGADKQDWENAHVDDYAKTGGAKKDRRWAEGSTTVKTYTGTGVHRRAVYYLTYSANNYENEFYGVGYAVSDSPLGPWRKSEANPVLSQDPAEHLYSTGHGSMVSSPDGRRQYYVHHGRPSTVDSRRIYTAGLRLGPVAGRLTIDGTTSDRPIPPGVAPFRLRTGDRLLRVPPQGTGGTTIEVTSAAGAAFDLTDPLNRVRAELKPASAGTATVEGGRVTVRLRDPGAALLTLTYQRAKAAGGYTDVHQNGTPVSARIPVLGLPGPDPGQGKDQLRVPMPPSGG